MADFTLEIKPRRGVLDLGWRELHQYRELFYFLIWRDLKVRYKQSAFGAAWAVLQPLSLMVVFSIFLGRLARVPSDDLPYPVFVYAGLVPWTLFSQALAGASDSLVNSRNLVSKVYFPRLLIPAAAASSYLLDFLIALVLLGALALIYGVPLAATAVWLPLIAVLGFVVALAVGIWFAALNVRYRDVRYAVPLLIQVWLFATPVAYPSSLVPTAWRPLLGLNPMVGVVEGFRWALFGGMEAPVLLLGLSGVGAALLLLGGLYYFQRSEASFADLI